MCDRTRVNIPLHVLDELWPVPVSVLTFNKNRQMYLDHLDRYVDMGVLCRMGQGTNDSPYHYSWVWSAPRDVLSTLYDEPTRRLLAEHHLSPEMVDLALAGMEWDAA